MFASWIFISLTNIVFTVFFWLKHKQNHNLLAPFFTLFTVTDLGMFIICPDELRGLGLIILPHDVWVAVASALWLSWFALIPISALCLARDRLKISWFFYYGVPLVGIACSELIGASPDTRRVLMHWAYEPAVLVCGGYVTCKHATREAAKGILPDFMVFVLAATTLLLGLKILLLLSPGLRLHRNLAHAYYYVHITSMLIMYFMQPRIKRWLRRL